MVVPNLHVRRLAQLTDARQLDLWNLTNRMVAQIEKQMKPAGLNIGINFGRVGGAGLPGHVHVHVVPRWVGDTNFMTITGKTRVISESLESVRRKLRIQA